MRAQAEEAADAVASAAVKSAKERQAVQLWRLVRSVRRSGKVIDETVAQLGEHDAEGRTNTRLLAQQITGRAPTAGAG